MNGFPLSWGTKHKYPLSPLLLNTVPQIPATAIWREKPQISGGEKKSLFENMPVYLENRKQFTKKSPRISEFNKVRI